MLVALGVDHLSILELLLMLRGIVILQEKSTLNSTTLFVLDVHLSGWNNEIWNTWKSYRRHVAEDDFI